MAEVSPSNPTSPLNRRVSRDRSPNFPSIGLEPAIARTRAVYSAEGRNFAPMTAIYDHWGFSHFSSGARQTMAALNAYGLLDFKGSGDTREAKVSPRALSILLDLPDRTKALREAALAPRIHRDLWTRYGQSGLPSDSTLRSVLIQQLDFNPDTTEPFIAQFRSTLEFAGIATGTPENGESDGNPDPADGPPPKVGDFAQWTSQGQAQFVLPKRIVDITEGYALFEGERTGVPLSELTVEKSPPAPAVVVAEKLKAATPATPSPIPQQPWKQEVFTTPEGDIVVRYPVKVTLAKDELEDARNWLDIVKRKVLRAAQSPQ